jgi:PAS domain S-box-containing protein
MTSDASSAAQRSAEPTESVKPKSAPFASVDLFAGGGELGALMRTTDWSKTALGPVETWPQNLKTCVRIVLTSRQPMFVWWGDQLINLYNDAYKSIVGGKHPQSLGQPASVVWREIWDQISIRAESAMAANEGTYDESLLLIMQRYGYPEETYYTFSYSPVPNDQGGTGGIICANTDDTQRIISERQLALLRELAALTGDARTWQEACRFSALSLQTNAKDLCFALIYVVEDSKDSVILAGETGMQPGHPAAPARISLADNAVWPVAEVLNSHEIQVVSGLRQKYPSLPVGAWDRPPDVAAVVPIAPSGPTGRPGVMAVGLNPYRRMDEGYRGFLQLAASQISASIANAEAYEQERRRAEALAELDRAKTTFFSNVSHEFRTPLTLMLGPIEDELNSASKAGLPADHVRRLEVVHRNGLRLLKLVNTLLDFSRIEAGRVQAAFKPVNLSTVTAELASVFRSAMEKAGLQFDIRCDALPQPVYVDPEMWEKIVLNLLSNAFKFTLDGEVELKLRAVGNNAELSLRDTGSGIPTDEISKVFERFHRIEGTGRRTHEGTGIGLALVDELVKLHGGTVSVESQLGKGSTFTVTIPFGTSHLPAEKVSAARPGSTAVSGAAPYVQEALRWLPTAPIDERTFLGDSANEDLTSLFGAESERRPTESARVLLADDNRDMREYVQRLLARQYTVVAVENGEQALAEAIKNPPDIILTDIMMPKLDGFGLLKALRDDPRTAAIPVIMLSARAGEEAQSEGMEAGANDYLVKPFTARELMARVGAHLAIHKLRSELTAREHEQRLRAEASEQQYRMILESISEGFVFVNRDLTIEYVNRQAADIVGREQRELVGKSLWELLPELRNTKFGDTCRQALETGKMMQVEEHYGPADRWIHVNFYPSQDGLSLFIQDATEKRRQQEQLLVSEKLAATGRLAATIAHEINNPLESTINLIYLARTSPSTGDDSVRQYLLTAEKELARVSQIARHTLGFYRETSVPANTDLAQLLDDVLAVYQTILKAKGIRVVKEYHAAPPIYALRGELHQVVSNLVSNAIDAQTQGGELRLTLLAREQDGDRGVEIRVHDTGSGVPSNILPKLFEPFFTTKASVGTGLGLWVVKQFVQNHSGTVTVESSTNTKDHGTTFVIFLPVAAKPAAEGVAVPAKSRFVM